VSTLKVKGISAPTGYNLQMPAGAVIQVVTSGAISDFSTTAHRAWTASNTTLAITPKFSSSKVFVVITQHVRLAGGSIAVTGLSLNITPSSSSNKILLFATVNGARSGNLPLISWIFKRGSTAIGIGDASSNRGRTTAGSIATSSDPNAIVSVSSNYMDSPATTSQITYSIDIFNTSGASRTLYVNHAASGADDAGGARQISTITAMEIQG